jgi:hypothetical protein
VVLLLSCVAYSGYRLWSAWEASPPTALVIQLEEQPLELKESDMVAAITETEPKEVAPNEVLTAYRLERKRSLSRQISQLEEIIDRSDLSGEVRDMASQRLMMLLEQSGREEKIEMLVQAAGIKECVAILEQDQLNILLGEAVGADFMAELRGMMAQTLTLPAEHISFIVRR